MIVEYISDDGRAGYGGRDWGIMGAAMSPQEVEQELIRVAQNIHPNHILLVTVLNAQYPIDVHIMAKVGQSILVSIPSP